MERFYDMNKWCNSTVRVYLDFPIIPTDDIKILNKIFDILQSQLVKSSTKVLSICNLYASILINKEKQEADKWVLNNFNNSKIENVLYNQARSECMDLNAQNTAQFSREIYNRYFKGKNSYFNSIQNGTGNPPMTYTSKLPIPLIKDGASVERSKDQTARFYDVTFPFLSRDGVKNMSKIMYGKDSNEKCCGKLTFQTNAKDDNTYRVLENIVNGKYKLCGSKLTRVKKKNASSKDKRAGIQYDYILLLSYSHPVKEHNLDPEKIMGVDIGVKVPAMCAVNYNDRYRKSLGGNKILEENMRQHRINKKKQIEITYNCRDGHGRTAKLNGWDGKGHKINNRNATYNNVLSKRVVDQSIKWGCGTIHMEDLSGITSNSNKFLKNWPYYDLQQKIIDKAEQNGIIVKKINPYHTSQTCSVCGYTDKNNRPKGEKGQAYFKCCRCGFETNADFNAARNIAMSTDFGGKKKKITYKKKVA